MTVNKIAVAGTGYVDLSFATLLAQRNSVVAVDVVQEKVDLINNHKSPIQDNEIEDFLANRKLNLVETTEDVILFLIARLLKEDVVHVKYGILKKQKILHIRIFLRKKEYMKKLSLYY